MAWTKFPHPDKAYEYTAATLKKHWDRLHRGDREPFPTDKWVGETQAAHAKLGGGDAKATAKALQEAWIAFHAGDFERAAKLGDELGLIGATVANKATGIYANYLESDEATALDLYQAIAARAQRQQAAASDWANAFYFEAYALGRYSQGISVVKALAQGLGGRIKAALDKAVKIEPEHADAHIALGTYHAEIIDKVGAMVGGLTYGASKDKGEKHFKRALELNPESAIARIECANGMVMMFGKSRIDQASEFYEQAAECTPVDAMERLDVELAKSELE